jgi:hypothetical protein
MRSLPFRCDAVQSSSYEYAPIFFRIGWQFSLSHSCLFLSLARYEDLKERSLTSLRIDVTVKSNVGFVV